VHRRRNGRSGHLREPAELADSQSALQLVSGWLLIGRPLALSVAVGIFLTDAVAPSDLATQPIGEAAQVAEGVYQLKLPVPLPLRFVSVYLVEGDDGWTIVDTGYHYPPTYEFWESGAAAVGCDLERNVIRIVVTHFHPDHLGGARWLQERSGAPVYILEEEISNSRALWCGEPDATLFVDHLSRHGMPHELAASAAAKMRASLPLPEQMLPLGVGEKLYDGSSALRVVHAPGHADYQLMLHDEERGILFAADHVLLKITPNIGLWSESKPHPLARYLESIEGLRGLDASLVLPGHSPVFHDLDGRISELVDHHEERLDFMHSALNGTSLSSYEVSRKAFRGALTVYQRCFALTETLAHLDHLELEGRAQRIDNGIVSYSSV
jgi:glyoxylase-like metal-dependent hydrolase (beta-lactamase superfamily II)